MELRTDINNVTGTKVPSDNINDLNNINDSLKMSNPNVQMARKAVGSLTRPLVATSRVSPRMR